MNVKQRISFIFLALFLAFTAACAAEPQIVEVTRVVSETVVVRQELAIAADAAPAPGMEVAQAGNSSNAPVVPSQRLIIRTGNVDILVADTEETLAQIGRIAEQMEGWVVNSSTSRYQTSKRGNITIRIPSAQFEAVMNQIKGMAVSVISENTAGQDVTEEYVDLGARLGNLEATAERVRGFLDETQTVEEALSVNKELSRLEGEIEVIKGRMQYLSQSAAFSTIYVNLTPDIVAQPIQPTGWRPQGEAREALDALISALQGFANFLIWLVIYFLPLFVIVILPGYFAIRWLWRRMRE